MVQHLHQNQRKQEKDPMMASDIAVYPFQIVGTDLFHWNGQNFSLVVDYRSKYWKIERLNSTTSGSVIQKLKMFSRLSMPEVVRSDNETQYLSGGFTRFAESWRFSTCPYSPEYLRSNGIVERYAQVVKNMLTEAKDYGQDPYLVVLEARNIPVDGSATSAQLCGRTLRAVYHANKKS